MKDAAVVELEMTKFLEICREVYEAGMSGSGDLRENAIEEVLVKNNISLADKWKVYTTEELSKMPIDTVFIHSMWGRCRIAQRPDGEVKFMSFVGRGPVDFRSNLDPWDKPMKLVG